MKNENIVYTYKFKYIYILYKLYKLVIIIILNYISIHIKYCKLAQHFIYLNMDY